MKDVLDWVSNSHWAVKVFVAVSLLIIASSLLFIVYINNQLSNENKTNPAQRQTPTEQFQKGRPLSNIEYENTIIDQYDKWKILTERLTNLMKDTTTRDDKWFRYTSVQVTQMKMLVNKAYQINPPYEHEVAHKSYMQAIDEFSWISDNLITAITENDSKLSNKCMEKLNKGNTQLDISLSRIEQGL